jgi:large subunit ribosomal protein L13
MKTSLLKNTDVRREWFVVDATGKPLGRLAVQIANLLRGRGKPTFTPHVDSGDFVIVTNANKVKLTGSKAQDKVYWTYSGYRGGRKIIPITAMVQRHPERIFEKAVKGMLPGNTLSRTMIKRLKVYVGTEHPHTAQAPKAINLVG